jgi:hypothetical protein
MSVSPAINMTPISIAPAPPMPIHICPPPPSDGPVRIVLVAATIATAPMKMIANAAFSTADFSALFRTRARITRAMAAGVTPKLWEMSDMVKVLEDWENAR